MEVQQQSLYVTQGRLFSVADSGTTTDRGTCGCALVALPVAGRPKYSLVWYSKKRETIAVARLPATTSGSDPSSSLTVSTSGYLTFRDEVDARWSFLPAKPETLLELLAQVALATYVLRGSPSTLPVVTDYAPATVEVGLGLHHEARVRFVAYTVRPRVRAAAGAMSSSSSSSPPPALEELGPVRESNMGDQQPPYTFQPVQSSVVLSEGHRGFEACVQGMREGTYRGIVLPIARPYTAPEEMSVDRADFLPVVYVVRLERVVELASRTSEVPTVFAESSSNNNNHHSGGGAVHNGNGARAPAALVPYHTPQSRMPPTGAGPGATLAASTTDGDGVPAEHMAMVQRIGAGINTAVTAARDIRDVASAVAADWERAARPTSRPSTLTHAALLDQLRQLVLQHEQGASDLQHREELLRSLDTRNRELQRQVDTAALTAQKLLDASKSAASAGMDVRLERSRALVKLQEQVNTATHERDDAQRHLATVKRLHAAAEEELRQLRARADIHRVQAAGALEQMETAQAALAEARGRRRGLEARVSSLTEAIRSAQAQARVKAGELEAARAAADQARVHHLQLMEDERNSRAADGQQLRREIVDELAQRERGARAERARVAEESFRQGLEEGRAAGRREAVAEVAAQQQELHMALQRGQTRVASTREELRAGVEAAFAARRRLQEAVRESQAALSTASRDRTRLQFRRDRLVKAAATAREVVLARVRGVARYLSQPATPAQLLEVLSALRMHGLDLGDGPGRGDGTSGSTGIDLDIAFNRKNREAARREAVGRRCEWIEAEVLRVAEKGMRFYFQECLQTLTRAHEACREAVRVLWVAEHGAAHYSLCDEEHSTRHAIAEEREAFMASLASAREERRLARVALGREAEVGKAELFTAFTDGLARVRALREEQLRARQALAAAETAARQDITAAAVRAHRELPTLFADAVLSSILTGQRYLAEAEEAGRAALVADELSSATVLRFTEEQARAEARQATLRHRQRDAIREAETNARAELVTAEALLREAAERQLLAGIHGVLQQAQAARRQLLDAELAETHAREQLLEGEAAAWAVVGSDWASVVAAEEQRVTAERARVAEAASAAAAAAAAAEAAASSPPATSAEPPTPPPPTVAPRAPAAPPPAPPPSQPVAAVWADAPGEPPPTPPDSPHTADGPGGDREAMSPFAVAWAQSDSRASPVPGKARPVSGTAVPPAAPAPAKKRKLFASGSDDD